MKKTITALILTCALILTSALTASCISVDQIDEYISVRVLDYAGVIPDEQELALENEIYDTIKQYEADVFVCIVETLDGADSLEYLNNFYDEYGFGIGDSFAGVMLLISADTFEYAINSFGDAETAFNDAALSAMEYDIFPYLEQKDIPGACSSFVYDAKEILEYAENGQYYCFPDDGEFLYTGVIDYAGILTDEQVTILDSQIYEIANKYACDVVIFTDNSLGDYFDALAYLEALYRECDFGIGESKSGIMLLISLDDRDFAINSFGNVGLDGAAFNDAALEVLEDGFKPYLNRNDYYGAFNKFVSDVDYTLECAENGQFYYYNSDKKSDYEINWTIVLPLLIAVLIGWIVAANFKKKMDTAVSQADASYYLKQGSFKLTASSDTFLYSTVIKTERQEKSSSGGSVSMGSSGSSHSGGRSGKF